MKNVTQTTAQRGKPVRRQIGQRIAGGRMSSIWVTSFTRPRSSVYVLRLKTLSSFEILIFSVNWPRSNLSILWHPDSLESYRTAMTHWNKITVNRGDFVHKLFVAGIVAGSVGGYVAILYVRESFDSY